jgi:hypothetical protein
VPDPDDDGLADVVASLRGIEERLRDAAYEALRARVDGDEAAGATERRLLQARRAVERALRALGGEPDD